MIEMLSTESEHSLETRRQRELLGFPSSIQGTLVEHLLMQTQPGPLLASLSPTPQPYAAAVVPEHLSRVLSYLSTPRFRSRASLKASSVQILQKWEGEITEVTADAFTARLRDLTQGSPEETGEFPVAEVAPEDMCVLLPGARFFWIIGYRDSAAGQRSRFSQIRFRRFPPIALAELEAARQKAERLNQQFGW